jgi:exosome complex RNA-binding protein Rrp42 (RNase PH superfamily)
MALMSQTQLTISWMTNGIDSDMKVAVMLFTLAVIDTTMIVEAVVDEADVCMEDAAIILEVMAITMLEP